MIKIYTDIRVTRRNRLHQLIGEKNELIQVGIDLDVLLKKAYDLGFLTVLINDKFQCSTVLGGDISHVGSTV